MKLLKVRFSFEERNVESSLSMFIFISRAFCFYCPEMTEPSFQLSRTKSESDLARASDKTFDNETFEVAGTFRML